jgi:geranylgeranylglycerol-phosphate geranylgeranyltransferase
MTSPDLHKARDRYIGKLTMKEPYAKTKYLSVRVRAILDLFRPFTLLAPFIVSMSIVVAGLIYSNKEIPVNWWLTVGQASFTVVLVNAASNALNQATDVEADRISKPYRPIPRGLIKPEEAQSIAYLFYLFALIRAITLSPMFGFFIFMIMIFTVTYSLPPRMKKYLFVNQIWIAIPRGMLGILASWSVFGNPLEPAPLIIGGVATIYLIGGMSTKDITDSEADKRTGTRTLINTYGEKKTALICLPFMLFPFIVILIMVERGFLDTYLLPLVSLVALSFFIVYLMIRSKESKSLENVHAWSIMYLQYILLALGFSLLTIFGELGGLSAIFR